MTKKKQSLLDMAKTMKSGEAPPAAVTEKPKPAAAVKKPSPKAKPATATTGKVTAIKDMAKEDLTAMHIRLPKATHKRLKFQSIEEDRPMNDIIFDAVEAYLRGASGPARKRA